MTKFDTKRASCIVQEEGTSIKKRAAGWVRLLGLKWRCDSRHCENAGLMSGIHCISCWHEGTHMLEVFSLVRAVAKAKTLGLEEK